MTRRRPLPLLLLLVALLLCGGSAAASAAAAPAAQQPWRVAEAVRSQLFEAQTALILDTRADAARAVARARASYAEALEPTVRAADPDADRAILAAFADAARAASAGDQVALAAARGEIRAALFAGSYVVTLDAVADGDAATARQWLLLREFRTATRFTRPGGDATLAVQQLARGRATPEQTRAIVAKDLLDAYQGRLRELLDDAARGAERDLPARRAEASAQAAGYSILLPRYLQDMGDARADRALAAYAALQRAALAGDAGAFGAAHADAVAALDGFTAAPLTAEEAARRAQQLLRFLALVPVEYGRGVKDGRVDLDFEIQEAVAFQTGATAAFQDLQATLAKRDPAATRAVAAQLARLGAIVDEATKRKEGVAPSGDVDALTATVEDGLEAIMPPAWQEETDESDYDLIALTLDRMEAAAGAGQYQQAEQARLEAYAFFEFGPERRLKAFDPGLALDVEGLIWFGALDHEGLANLIDTRASRREIHETRLALDEQLGDAAATLGDSANKTQVVVNSAILVFREGLEAVLILAAITASFVGAKRRMRRPVLIGAGLGLLASVITWVLAQTILTSLDQYGEKLEAVVGVVAIAVLLLITNWFFHKVYWSEWIGKFHRQRKRLERFDKVGFLSAQVIGLLLLGLTSVYREGFETVLFLQSLELSAGTATVVEGAGLGLAMVLAVAVLTFALQRKLPYKKMLIVTGVMIGFVLVVMVGQTARTMQGTGWLPITPMGFDPPYWASLWFGVYPTWETVGAQFAAAAFVIGSYYLAQEVRVRRPQRLARRRRAQAATAGEQPAMALAGDGDGADPASSPRMLELAPLRRAATTASLARVLDNVTQVARDAVTTLGYPGIFAAMVAENLFPPIPSEVVLPLAGFEVDAGELNFLLVVVAATLGSLAGALILYAIGLYGGRPLVLRWGRVLRVSARDLDRAEQWFERWGDWVVLGARVVPIARSLVSIPAGTMRMGLLRFSVLTALGSLVWNCALVFAGKQLGSNWEDVTDLIAQYALVIRVAAVLALLAAGWWVCKRVAAARAQQRSVR